MSGLNRTIKFKGKRVDDGEWVYGYFVRDTMVQTEESMCLGDCRIKNVIIKDGVMWHVKPETVCQQSDIKDNTTKYIWENDWVEYYGKKGQVIFAAGCFEVMFLDGTEKLLRELFGNNLRVVGDIFEEVS